MTGSRSAPSPARSIRPRSRCPESGSARPTGGRARHQVVHRRLELVPCGTQAGAAVRDQRDRIVVIGQRGCRRGRDRAGTRTRRRDDVAQAAAGRRAARCGNIGAGKIATHGDLDRIDRVGTGLDRHAAAAARRAIEQRDAAASSFAAFVARSALVLVAIPVMLAPPPTRSPSTFQDRKAAPSIRRTAIAPSI